MSDNGRIRFLTAAGITLDEEDLIASWDARPFLGALREGNPLLVTDPQRGSRVDETMRERARREGSQREVEFFGDLRVESEPGMNRPVRLTLDAIEAHVVARLLRGRITHRRRAQLVARNAVVQLVPAEAGYEPWTADTGQELTLGIPTDRAEVMAADIEARTSVFGWPWFPELTIVRES